MFSFFKKAKTINLPKEPERHYLPESSIHLLYDILDEFNSGKHPKKMKYRLWCNIADIFPTLDIKNEKWGFDCSNIMKPYIYKNR